MKPAVIVRSLLLACFLFALAGMPFLHEAGKAGQACLELQLATNSAGWAQLYFDDGAGYSEPRSSRLQVVGDGQFHVYRFDLPLGKIKALRLDPLDSSGEIRLRDLRILDPSGVVLMPLKVAEVRPLMQIASLEAREAVLAMATTAGATDPALELALPRMLVLERPWLRPLLPALAVFASFVLLSALCLSAPLERGLRWLEEKDRSLPWILAGIVTVLLWVCLFEAPSGLDSSADGSWHAALIDAHAKGRLFGEDLVFTYGPWGFVFACFWPPEGLALKLGWEYWGKLALIGIFVLSTLGIPLWRRLALYAALMLFAVLMEASYIGMLVCILAACISARNRPYQWRLILWLAAAAFLSQTKFTYCMITAVGVGCGTVLALARRDWLRALQLSVGFSTLWLFWWFAAGQGLGNVMPFLTRAWEVGSGYTWAMGLEESALEFGLGLTLVLLLGLRILSGITQRRVELEKVLLGLFACFVLFLVWKHGYTRATGHVMVFFCFCTLLVCLLPDWFGGKPGLSWSDLLMVPCVAGVFLSASLSASPLELLATRMRDRLHLMTHPGAIADFCTYSTEQNRSRCALPEVQKIVGKGSVDELNYDQGILLLNGLNYHPRPVLQSYSSYTPALMELNRRFILSEKRPEYLLVRHSTIDDRYAAQDDALLLAELPRLYEHVLDEKGYSLLRRRQGVPELPVREKKVLDSSTLAFGATKALSGSGTEWLELRLRPSLLGSLRALVYKPVSAHMVLTDSSGREQRFRLLTKSAEAGFLINPALESQEDFVAFLRGVSARRVRSLRIEVPACEQKYWSTLELSVCAP